MHLGIRNIDHPVIASRDLDATRAQFERLGFTVPPRGSHIEWGTGNLCIMFPDDYLEVRGIIDPGKFTMHLDTHLEERGEGLMGVAFGTADVKASFEEARANGINTGELRSLRRNFEHPEGWTQPAFSLFAPDAEDIEGLMHVVIIEHLTPELIRRPDFLEHANGCVGISAMSGTVTDIESCTTKMRRLLGDGAIEQGDDEIVL
ncbi:MAG: VOC family protein, partial [Woeseiaceae bacterium]